VEHGLVKLNHGWRILEENVPHETKDPIGSIIGRLAQNLPILLDPIHHQGDQPLLVGLVGVLLLQAEEGLHRKMVFSENSLRESGWVRDSVRRVKDVHEGSWVAAVLVL
jgi:hypothetical protein